MIKELYNGVVVEYNTSSADSAVSDNGHVAERNSFFNDADSFNKYALLKRHDEETIAFWGETLRSKDDLVRGAKNE